MAEDYKYKIHIDRFNAVAQLLADHYGLGVYYFERYGNREGDYIELEFPCSDEDFISCFKSERKFRNTKGEMKLKKTDLPYTPENKLVIDAIWLMTSICSLEIWDNEIPDEFSQYMSSFVEPEWEDDDRLQDFLADNHEEWLDQFYDEKARKDLLELYLYHKQKPKGDDDPTQITIKYGKGKSVKLENKDNWFERVLLPNHFERFLPNIKSEEDAINALNILSYKGRKLHRPLMYHFIYGTYSMVSEHLGKESVSESFCELLIELMGQMDYQTEYVYQDKTRDMDSLYIRKIISKLKQEAKKYRFNLDIMIRATQEDLKQSDRRLYNRMAW